jgi:hypothetical protein
MLSAAMALPCVIALTLTLVFMWRDMAGETPFSYGLPRNVAEAAGMGNAAEILRVLPTLDDPHRVWPVRPEIISSSVQHATVLEAAVWSRRGGLMVLLDRRGLLVDAATRAHVTCLAVDLAAQEIVDALTRAGTPACQPGAALERVLARSRQP